MMQFAKLLAEKAAELVVGDGLAGVTQQGPLINDTRAAKGRSPRRRRTRPWRQSCSPAAQRHSHGGTFYQPTVLRDVAPTRC
jgi:succinate-semialdehyde dehydrogenase/glutarate-semialdehyde dehydrogenase